MKGFWITLLHIAVGGAAVGAANLATGASSFKQICLGAVAGAITSVAALFTQKPGTEPTK